MNFQQHMAPILATRSKAEGGEETKEKKTEDDRGEESSRHHPLLLKLIADEIDARRAVIVDFDLQLCDTQPSAIGGAQREFVYSGRLDNLVSCYTSLHALLNASTDEALEKASGVRRSCTLTTKRWAASHRAAPAGAMTTDAIKRIAAALNPEAVEGLDERTRRASFCVSSDMAHALHPNYADRHEPAHAPKMHGGLVIKHNANQRYATDAVTAFMFRELGERAGVPVQEFVVRSDTGCGSTIGPIFSTRTGIRTVDAGAAQLSMHSIREVCGADDIDHAVTHLTALFLHFIDLDRTLIVDGAIARSAAECDVFESASQMSPRGPSRTPTTLARTPRNDADDVANHITHQITRSLALSPATSDRSRRKARTALAAADLKKQQTERNRAPASHTSTHASCARRRRARATMVSADAARALSVLAEQRKAITAARRDGDHTRALELLIQQRDLYFRKRRNPRRTRLIAPILGQIERHMRAVRDEMHGGGGGRAGGGEGAEARSGGRGGAATDSDDVQGRRGREDDSGAGKGAERRER